MESTKVVARGGTCRLQQPLPVALLAANVIFTTWVVFWLHPLETAFHSDMGLYVRRAGDMLKGVFDPIHFFQPIGYSLWIALCYRIANHGWWLLKVSHVVFVSASVFLGWRIARRLLPASWALLALVLLSVHLQWPALASFALSETLYTFLITLLVWSAVRWAQKPKLRFACLTGFAFAVGFYFKGSAALFPLLLAAWVAGRVFGGYIDARRAVLHLAVMGAVAWSVAFAHGSFAYVKYGQFKLGADAGGLNFVEGKCPSKRNFDNIGYQWLSPLFFYLGETEAKHWSVPFSNQKYYWREGWKCVEADPLVLLTSVRYVYYLFAGNPLWPVEERPHIAEQMYETYFTFAIVPFFVLGMLVALWRWRTPLAVPALLYLSLFFAVWIFKSELRFRVPFDAITMLYASFGASLVWRVTRKIVASRRQRSIANCNRSRSVTGRQRASARSSRRTTTYRFCIRCGESAARTRSSSTWSRRRRCRRPGSIAARSPRRPKPLFARQSAR